MNVYECLTALTEYDELVDDNWNNITHKARVWGLIAAETPAKARYILFKTARRAKFHIHHVTELSASIRIYRRNAPDVQPGMLGADHPIYADYVDEQNRELDKEWERQKPDILEDLGLQKTEVVG